MKTKCHSPRELNAETSNANITEAAHATSTTKKRKLKHSVQYRTS